MKTIGLLLFTLTANMLLAQKTDIALAKAYYNFSHVDDTNHRSRPIVSDMVLYLGKDGSLFRRLIDEESKPLLHESKGGDPSTFDILEECASTIQIDGKTTSVERIFDSMFLITEDAPSIKWEISDDTKTVNGHLVQKAKTHFRGRDYTVWFAPEIPFHNGPWKLKGLPGLILEAHDTKNEVVFTFQGFEQVENKTTKIAAPKGKHIKKVTQDEYDKIYQNFLKDPIAFGQATMGVKMVQGGAVSGGGRKLEPKKYNNPIELSKE